MAGVTSIQITLINTTAPIGYMLNLIVNKNGEEVYNESINANGGNQLEYFGDVAENDVYIVTASETSS